MQWSGPAWIHSTPKELGRDLLTPKILPFWNLLDFVSKASVCLSFIQPQPVIPHINGNRVCITGEKGLLRVHRKFPLLRGFKLQVVPWTRFDGLLQLDFQIQAVTYNIDNVAWESPQQLTWLIGDMRCVNPSKLRRGKSFCLFGPFWFSECSDNEIYSREL